MSDAIELRLRPHCVLNTRVRAQRGAAARWAALSAESTKPAGATAGSNPVAPTQKWDEQHRKLKEYYQPLIKKASKSYKKVTMLSEFLTHIRGMIQAGIHIKADQKLIRLGKGAITLTALVSEVYAPENRAVTEAVTHFLFDLKTLTDYGMNFDVNYYENEQGTRITVILHLSPLMAFDSTINSMQEYESGNPHGNYEAEIFEKNLQAELSRYDIDLKDEITRV